MKWAMYCTKLRYRIRRSIIVCMANENSFFALAIAFAYHSILYHTSPSVKKVHVLCSYSVFSLTVFLILIVSSLDAAYGLAVRVPEFLRSIAVLFVACRNGRLL